MLYFKITPNRDADACDSWLADTRVIGHRRRNFADVNAFLSMHFSVIKIYFDCKVRVELSFSRDAHWRRKRMNSYLLRLEWVLVVILCQHTFIINHITSKTLKKCHGRCKTEGNEERLVFCCHWRIWIKAAYCVDVIPDLISPMECGSSNCGDFSSFYFFRLL